MTIGNYTITTGTAIAATIGDTTRQPAIFVHANNDEFGNGNAIVYNVSAEEVDSLDEEDITEMMRDSASTDYEDIATFEADAK